MTNHSWPTTRGLKPVLDADAVRSYLQVVLAERWGGRVDQRITDLKLSGAQVAVLADTTNQTISKVRSGEMVPREYLRVTLAAALATTTDQLFPFPSMTEIEKAVAKRRRRAA